MADDGADKLTDRLSAEQERHPVAAGLIALVGVGLVVGLFAGLAVFAGTRMLGLGGGDASAETTTQESLNLPKPQETKGSSGPLITLAPGETSSPPQDQPSEKETTEASPKKQISLSASQNAVAPMEQIDLTGVYPGGEGAVLQVQRFTSGSWTDFPVTVSVSDETFSTYVQTSQSGPNRFRVVDTDSGRKSNEVKVTIG
ncbi:MAG: hypothetical protein ACRDOM_09770 [Nocardioides sp.]